MRVVSQRDSTPTVRVNFENVSASMFLKFTLTGEPWSCFNFWVWSEP